MNKSVFHELKEISSYCNHKRVRDLFNYYCARGWNGCGKMEITKTEIPPAWCEAEDGVFDLSTNVNETLDWGYLSILSSKKFNIDKSCILNYVSSDDEITIYDLVNYIENFE